MSNKISSEAFKHLRVYKHLSVPYLLNGIACNQLMKLNFLVDRAPQIYHNATKLLGKNFVNEVIHSTYCKVFTAGTTVNEANEASAFFHKQGSCLYI